MSEMEQGMSQGTRMMNKQRAEEEQGKGREEEVMRSLNRQKEKSKTTNGQMRMNE